MATALELIKSGLTKLLEVTDVGPNTELAQVDSSAISEIGYNRARSVMTITFNSGSVYNYYGVPESQYEDLAGASSVGRTFVREVRNDYTYLRLN